MRECDTITFYDVNAQKFALETKSVDFGSIQKKFTDKLRKGALILDFGCGSGRDTKRFLEQGYAVEAVDGSFELCKLASEYTGVEVKQMLFQDLEEVEKYDGIWACSSILHLPVDELAGVMGKMAAALKDGGIIYTSFKYGTFAGVRNGRYFTDMTEDAFADYMEKIEKIAIEEQWISTDVKLGRGDERWLNLILRKG